MKKVNRNLFDLAERGEVSSIQKLSKITGRCGVRRDKRDEWGLEKVSSPAHRKEVGGEVGNGKGNNVEGWTTGSEVVKARVGRPKKKRLP